VCDCVVKDSINFLDHINGKKHQRNLGMSMKVERSSLDQVKKRFEMNKRKEDDKKKEYDFEERIKELKEEVEKLLQFMMSSIISCIIIHSVLPIAVFNMLNSSISCDPVFAFLMF
jgi:DNA-binding transcriptional MerR regulator